MSDHTPAPWIIEPFDSYDKDIFIRPPDARVDYDDVDHDEAEANARLIAAAPDLLEALEGIMGLLDSGTLVRNTANDGAATWALDQLPLIKSLQDAQSAIAKAKGTPTPQPEGKE